MTPSATCYSASAAIPAIRPDASAPGRTSPGESIRAVSGKTPRLCLLRVNAGECAALCRQAFDQRCDLPPSAVLGRVGFDLLGRVPHADDVVHLPHGSPAPGREAVAVEVHDIAIAGPERDALLHDLGALVGKAQQAALDDLVGRDVPLLDLQGLGLGADQRLDLGIDNALAAGIVLVVAGPRLLAVPAHLDDFVGHARELRGLTGELPLLADAIAHVEAGEIAHRQGPHRHTPGLQCAIDFAGHGAFERHGLHLVTVGCQHAVADEAVAHAGLHAHLADAFGEAHRSRHHVVGRLLRADDLEQPHDVGG